ncbi:MAG: histidine kinase dimerization/phosphoacceptor domain -containing protein [Hyphomonadaceae bacterium]
MGSGGILETKPTGGVRAAVALLILIPVLVPLFAVLLIWLSERDVSSAANERVRSAASVVSANARLLVESTLERLRVYDERLGSDPAGFVPQQGAVENTFTAIYDTEGRTIQRGGARGPSISTNTEFLALKEGAPWTITAMLGDVGTLRFFGIARRIERGDQFAGIVAAYVAADALSEVWGEVALGAGSTVAMVRTDGWLVTRFPVPDKAQNFSGQVLFENVRKAPEGVYSSNSPIDDQPRIVAYTTLDDLKLIVTASMSRNSTEDAFWRRVGNTALVAAPIFLALVFLSGWAILLLLRHERNRVQLEAALAQNRVLFQEIHHRVKNNLQQVMSLIRLQQAPAAMKEDLTRRIAAMSAVHQHIYESDQFGVVDAEAYLARVLTGLRDSAPPGVKLDWTLAPLQLSPDQALPLGLIVNEIVSNAFKHGFPDGCPGSVRITLEQPVDSNEAVLAVADNGVGMAETPAGGMGLGTRLITGLAQQLGGRTNIIRGNGVRVELRFPIVTPSTTAG